jgi:hypothetical protein
MPPLKQRRLTRKCASKSRESSRPRKAVEFLSVNPDDETGIVSPDEYAQKYFMGV